MIVADDVSRWQALGLVGSTNPDGRWHCLANGVAVTVDPRADVRGIVAWGFDTSVESHPDIGIAFAVAEPPPPFADDRLLGVDHVVLMTDSLDRTCGAVEQVLGAPLKRVREVGGGVRQGFHRLGDVILEVVERPGATPGPASCWGLVFTVTDLDALVAPWDEDLVSGPRDAVQPGRRIASLRQGAGLATAVAFMTPHRSVESPG